MYYTLFEFENGLKIYTFGIIFIGVFILFLWMLNHLSKKYKYDFDLFKNNILVIFLSSFIFARLFYIIFHWQDSGFIRSFRDFIINTNYNFSLYGLLFGFFFVLLIILKIRKENIIKYIDGIVLSFFFVLWIGYIGAFLGGQIYGITTESWIGIYYDSARVGNIPFSPTVKVFPLALIYSALTFATFCGLYILRLYVKKKGFIGYLGLGIFSCITLTLEFFNGKSDIVKYYFHTFNANQVCAVFLLIFSFCILFKMLRLSTLEGPTNIIEDNL